MIPQDEYLCIGGSADGRRVMFDGSRLSIQIPAMDRVQPLLDYVDNGPNDKYYHFDIYHLTPITFENELLYVWILGYWSIIEAIERLIARYPKNEL